MRPVYFLFGIVLIVAMFHLVTQAEPWLPGSHIEIEATVEDGVITTAPQPSASTFNTYTTTDRSDRLNHLRQLNAPPVNQAPETEIHIYNHNEITIDRKRHDARQRRARQHTPTPMEIN
jgi:hypothetical protein